MRLCFTLFVLLFTQLFLNIAHAAPNAGVNADQRKSQASAAKTDDRRKRKPVKLLKKTRSTESEPLRHPEAKTDAAKTPAAVPRAAVKSAAKVAHPVDKTAASPRTKAAKTAAVDTKAAKVAKSKTTASRHPPTSARVTHSLASRTGAKKRYRRHRSGWATLTHERKP